MTVADVHDGNGFSKRDIQTLSLSSTVSTAAYAPSCSCVRFAVFRAGWRLVDGPIAMPQALITAA